MHSMNVLVIFPSFLFLAEKFLENIEQNEGYALMLLKLVERAISTQTSNPVVPLSAAIAFKNFVKRNWRKVSQS